MQTAVTIPAAELKAVPDTQDLGVTEELGYLETCLEELARNLSALTDRLAKVTQPHDEAGITGIPEDSLPRSPLRLRIEESTHLVRGLRDAIKEQTDYLDL